MQQCLLNPKSRRKQRSMLILANLSSLFCLLNLQTNMLFISVQTQPITIPTLACKTTGLSKYIIVCNRTQRWNTSCMRSFHPHNLFRKTDVKAYDRWFWKSILPKQNLITPKKIHCIEPSFRQFGYSNSENCSDNISAHFGSGKSVLSDWPTKPKHEKISCWPRITEA